MKDFITIEQLITLIGALFGTGFLGKWLVEKKSNRQAVDESYKGVIDTLNQEIGRLKESEAENKKRIEELEAENQELKSLLQEQKIINDELSRRLDRLEKENKHGI